MANRYWVGGSGTWNTSSTTNWSASSGGASGASVPTVADNVFFDQAATYTVTMTGALACLDITVSAGTVTFTDGAGPTLEVRGSMSLSAGTVWGTFGTVTFSSTATGRTVTTNGTSISGQVVFNGVGGGWTLGSALTLGSVITVTNGTFNTGNFNVTTTQFSSNNANIRTINLGSSTVTVSGATPVNFADNTNLTFNAGTSTFIFSSATTVTTGTVSNTGVTFYNVSLTSTSAGTTTFVSINTFNNLTITAPSAAGVRQIAFSSRQIINGTLSTTSTAGNRRVWFSGSTYGIAQTLTINSAPSLTDADFRDLYVVGTAAPISGTRIGDLRGIRGITASTPKTVYWNLAAGGNWSATAWAASSGGGVSTDNHPLAQDTAVIENTGLNTSATVTMDSAVAYTGTVTMSTRTNAMTLTLGANQTIYGDWTNGSGTTLSGGLTLIFSGRNTQNITSAGKTVSVAVTVDSFGGTVQLADALNIGGRPVTVDNGTFDTKSYSVTISNFNRNNSNITAIKLGASTVTVLDSTQVPFNGVSLTNLTFDAGTSQINCTTSNTLVNFNTSAPNTVYYNVAFTNGLNVTVSANAAFTANNIDITARTSSGVRTLSLLANCTVNGTLSTSGSSATQRVFIRSDTIGTTRTITAAAVTASDCDFRDITLAGAAAGSTPTRAGDCGGNTGITFTSKTVYWNLAGSQNWSATAWCTASGGTPDINQFPLAQDTAVFDNTGAAGTVTLDAAWNIGTFDASNRTSAMTFSTSILVPAIYGDWKFGTGVTSSSTTGALTFSKRGTQTITSNGVTFNCPITCNTISGTVQLADAITIAATRTLTLTTGTFDAVSYNVTTGLFNSSNTNVRTLKMGSGTWTLSGTGTVWTTTNSSNLALYKGTANITLSDTSTAARTFAGGNTGLSYNKLTIGGTAGTSTLTINDNNQFTELASTKTVAHTIALGTTTQTLGAWTVSGTAGNVVTVSGTGTIVIAGARVSGVDYLALGTTTISATSPGEFYAGANSTGGTNAILTAAPAPTTRYWVGGAGTWNAISTTNWSTGSGGGGGASVPTSVDAVVFDSASNATAYTVTCTATILRCGTLTISGPASGNVTWAGTAPIAFHDSVTLPATGLTRTYTGAITLTGSSASRTFTTNGVALASSVTANGVGCSWSLGSALNTGATGGVIVTNGSIDFAGYGLTGTSIVTNNTNSCSLNLGSGTTTLSGNPSINFGTSESVRANLTFTAGSSQLNCSATSTTFSGNNQTFNNVAFTYNGTGTITVNGVNSFNNLSFTGIVVAGLKVISLAANQTVTGTLTCSAGTNASMRQFIQSSVLGTARTITVAAASLTDTDFRDITVTGAAAPVSGTRLGDCKGNSGITFPAAKTVYWNLAGAQVWTATGWATSSGGSPSANNFPLAQDTAVFNDAGSVTGTITLDSADLNIGTVDMSTRTSAMTLNTGNSAFPFIYGNWSNGTGTTLSGTNALTFSGRGSQTITSAGKTWTQRFVIDTFAGSVTLQDALTLSQSSSSVLFITSGTFDANGYNVTLSGATAAVSSNNSNTRTIAVGSGTWTIAGSGTVWSTPTSINLTVTGTGTISLTSASGKIFAGGGVAYTNITFNQGGAGTLTFTGNNTFKDITNTYSNTGATTIALGTTTQKVSQFTATGASGGRTLTISGNSAASPGTLVLTGATKPNVDYLTVQNVRAYSLDTTWYAGRNSTNNGSLGWYFEAQSTTFVSVILETATGTDTISGRGQFSRAVSETGTGADSISADQLGPPGAIVLDSATGSDVVSARVLFGSLLSETATGTDLVRGGNLFIANIAETGSAVDLVASFQAYFANLLETATGSDTVSSRFTVSGAVAETATGTDAPSSNPVYNTTVTDSATVTDVASAALTYLRSVLETATAADVISTVQGYFSQIAEAATGTDALLVAPSMFNAPVVETATATDSFGSNAVVYASVTLSVTIGDTVVARFLWEPIDDTQTANWQNIGNTQTSGWTLIPTPQTPGWVVIDTKP